jgi:hypothetical protein
MKSLPFLDVLIARKPDGSIAHWVYIEKTHIEQYLYANFHHHPSQRYEVLNTLITRALRIFDDELLMKESDHLTQVFKDNGHQGCEIERVITLHRSLRIMGMKVVK